ncbi:MAG: hypothetical protein WCH84_07490, partial [Verrucomicrobiota bacterium]
MSLVVAGNLVEAASEMHYRCIEMKMALIRLLTGVVLAVLTVAEAAPPAGTADRLIQNERQQQLIRANIEIVSAQLRVLIDDYLRNGITGDEVQTLQNIANILARLTGPEIQRVIELLQSARNTLDAVAAEQRIVEAYSSQKIILVKLRQVVSEYRHRQALQEIIDRLTALADRQNSNLNLAITYIASAPETITAKPDESRLAVLAAQTAEQDAISAEIKIVNDQLAQFAKQPANAEIAARTSKTLTAIKTGVLHATLDAALSGLKAGQIFNAAGHEKNIRDQLRHLAKFLTAPSDPVDVLQQAATELDNIIRDQRQVATAAKALSGDDP